MAKQGLMKKYILMAKRAGATSKTLFKKAWRLQKLKAKSPAAIKRKVSKGVKKKTRTNPKKGVRKVAAKKRKSTRGGTPKRRTRRRVGLLSQTTVNALISGTTIAVPAIGGVWVVNNIPWVKDQRSMIKAGIQAAIGIAGLMFVKGALFKKVSSGIIAGGVMQLILPYVPGIKFGAGRRFSPSELATLQTMGKPSPVPGNGMGKPSAVPGAGGMSGRGRNGNR